MPRRPRNVWGALSQALGGMAQIYPGMMQQRRQDERSDERFTYRKEQDALTRKLAASDFASREWNQIQDEVVRQGEFQRRLDFDREKMERQYPPGWRDKGGGTSRSERQDALSTILRRGSNYDVQQGNTGFTSIPDFQAAADDAFPFMQGPLQPGQQRPRAGDPTLTNYYNLYDQLAGGGAPQTQQGPPPNDGSMTQAEYARFIQMWNEGKIPR